MSQNIEYVKNKNSFIEYLNEYPIKKSTKTELLGNDILFLPARIENNDIVFYSEIEGLYSYLKKHLEPKITVDLCDDIDHNFIALALYSKEHRFGKIFVKYIALPILISVLSAYINENITKIDETDIVDITIVVNKEEKKFNETVEFNFKGKADDFNELNMDNIMKVMNND